MPRDRSPGDPSRNLDPFDCRQPGRAGVDYKHRCPRGSMGDYGWPPDANSGTTGAVATGILVARSLWTSNRHRSYWYAVREYSVAMSGSAATPDESGAQPWVAFIGFGPEMRARPDDGLIHYQGAGGFLEPRTLCGKPGRRRWKGSGRLCRDCDGLAGPPDRSPQQPDSA